MPHGAVNWTGVNAMIIIFGDFGQKIGVTLAKFVYKLAVIWAKNQIFAQFLDEKIFSQS
jgi:hypothetical protein